MDTSTAYFPQIVSGYVCYLFSQILLIFYSNANFTYYIYVSRIQISFTDFYPYSALPPRPPRLTDATTWRQRHARTPRPGSSRCGPGQVNGWVLARVDGSDGSGIRHPLR